MHWPSCFPCRRRRTSVPIHEASTFLTFEDFPRDPRPLSVPRRRRYRRVPGSVAFDNRIRMDGSHHTPQHHSRVPHRGILRNAHQAPESRPARVPPHLFGDVPSRSWDRPNATPSPSFSVLNRLDPSYDERSPRLPPHLFRDAPPARPATPRAVPLVPQAATFQPPLPATTARQSTDNSRAERPGRVPPHLFRDAPRPPSQNSRPMRSPRLPPHLFRDRHHPYACTCIIMHRSMLFFADIRMSSEYTTPRSASGWTTAKTVYAGRLRTGPGGSGTRPCLGPCYGAYRDSFLCPFWTSRFSYGRTTAHARPATSPFRPDADTFGHPFPCGLDASPSSTSGDPCARLLGN